MTLVEEIHIPPKSIDRFSKYFDDEQMRAAHETAQAAASRMRGRVLWSVNSTARGGGVAEMLHPLIGYARGSGIDAR